MDMDPDRALSSIDMSDRGDAWTAGMSDRTESPISSRGRPCTGVAISGSAFVKDLQITNAPWCDRSGFGGAIEDSWSRVGASLGPHGLWSSKYQGGDMTLEGRVFSGSSCHAKRR